MDGFNVSTTMDRVLFPFSSKTLQNAISETIIPERE